MGPSRLEAYLVFKTAPSKTVAVAKSEGKSLQNHLEGYPLFCQSTAMFWSVM